MYFTNNYSSFYILCFKHCVTCSLLFLLTGVSLSFDCYTCNTDWSNTGTLLKVLRRVPPFRVHLTSPESLKSSISTQVPLVPPMSNTRLMVSPL